MVMQYMVSMENQVQSYTKHKKCKFHITESNKRKVIVMYAIQSRTEKVRDHFLSGNEQKETIHPVYELCYSVRV